MARWGGRILAAAALLALLGVGARAQAEEARLRPYVLATQGPGALAEKVAATRAALQGAGLEVAGEYPVSETAHVFVVTCAELKKAAAATPAGGFGAAARVSVTRVGDQVQVAYTNPLWVANVYRMGGDLADVAALLGGALGRGEEFGSKAGLTAKELRSYHYMVMMPYFTDPVVLAEYPSHEAALEKVERGLAGATAVRKIARVDVPGGAASLFAVAILEGKGADATVMRSTDNEALRQTAHLPYELLVSGTRALMLHGKFRIAQSFPDLGMGTFMKISCAPDDIERVLRKAVR
jgi:hypothetical protein